MCVCVYARRFNNVRIKFVFLKLNLWPNALFKQNQNAYIFQNCTHARVFFIILIIIQSIRHIFIFLMSKYLFIVYKMLHIQHYYSKSFINFSFAYLIMGI